MNSKISAPVTGTTTETVPPVTVSVVDCPAQMVFSPATAITGSASTFSVLETVVWQPLAS